MNSSDPSLPVPRDDATDSHAANTGDHGQTAKVHFIVCASPRCGSGLFCSLLENTGLLGHPIRGRRYEVLHPNRPYNASRVDWEKQDLKEFMHRILAEHGWFKIHWFQLAFLIRHARRSRRYRRLSPFQMRAMLPESTPLLLIYREDKLAQAVSMIKATAMKRWKRLVTEAPAEADSPKPNASLYEICYHLDDARRSDGLWRQFFKANQLECFACSYEELVDDTSRIIRQALRHLGVEPPTDLVIQTERMKLADTYNQTLIEKYQRSNRLLRGLCHCLARLSIWVKEKWSSVVC